MTEVEKKEKIERLKKEKNAVILAHYYVADELQEIADFTGDSFYLSQKAAESNADVIVFCGVKFMGESAKILCPDKAVYLPYPMADCPMAHMASAEGVKKLRESVDDLAVVCYINSNAELKAVADVCVTSSNALKIVKALPNKNIYFIPDCNLGRFVQKQCPDKKFYFSGGFCHVHAHLTAEDVRKAKDTHPQSLFLVHPECREEVTLLADYIGSTKDIIEYAVKSDKKSFIIGTEKGILYELKTRCPDKEFFLVKSDMVCPDMKKITLDNVLQALNGEVKTVNVPTDIAASAQGSLTQMLKLGK